MKRYSHGHHRIQWQHICFACFATYVNIEEERVDAEQKIHVDRHNHWEKYQRSRPHKLIYILVGNDAKRGRIVKFVVMFVHMPCCRERVAHTMVCKLQKVRSDPNNRELQHQILHGRSVGRGRCIMRRVYGIEAAISFREAALGEPKRQRWAQGGGPQAF